MFTPIDKHDIKRDGCQLYGSLAKCGFDRWRHVLTAHEEMTGEEKTFFIEYYLCNPASGADEPVFGQLKENPEKGIKPSYLMISAGALGQNDGPVRRFFGWNYIDVRMKAPFHVRAPECFCSEKELRGKITLTAEEATAHPEYMSGAGEISWDLKVRKKIAFNTGLSANGLIRRLRPSETFRHTEGLRTEYQGIIIFNGRKYIAEPDTASGCADKDWGRDLPSPWVWLRSDRLTSRITGLKLADSAFVISGPPAKMRSVFFYEGKGYGFNRSEPWDLIKTVCDCRETDDRIIWHVEQRTHNQRMVIDVACGLDELMPVRYESPDGSLRYERLVIGGNGTGTVRLYRKGILIDAVDAVNVWCEYGV